MVKPCDVSGEGIGFDEKVLMEYAPFVLQSDEYEFIINMGIELLLKILKKGQVFITPWKQFFNIELKLQVSKRQKTQQGYQQNDINSNTASFFVHTISENINSTAQRN